MAKVSLLKGSTSQILNIFIQDSASTTGAGKTGLAFNTASLTAYYCRPGAAAVAISLVTQTATGAYSSGGFVEVDATNMPGLYRLDIPNAALATGVNSVFVMLKGAAGMAPLPLEIELTATDNQDAVRGGMSALPNAAASAAGGLHTVGTGAGQINVDGAGNAKVDVQKWLAGTIPAVNVTGVPKVDVVDWLGSAPNALVSGRVDASVGALANNVITAASINAAALNGKGDWLLSSSYTAPPTAAAIATAIWQDLTASSDFSTANSIGALLKTFTFTGSNVNANTQVNSDKTGYTLTVTPPTAATIATTVWQDLLASADFGTASSIGALLKADIDAAISSRSTYAGVDTAGTTMLLSRIPSTLTITGGKVDINDKTGFSLISTGLDLVLVAGKTLPVAIKLIGATTAGKLPSGAGSGQENFQDFSGAAAVDVTVDASGNRTAVVYH